MMQTSRNAGRALPTLARAATVAAVAAGALFLAARPDGRSVNAAPSGVWGARDFVPADAVAVVSVHVADLWQHRAGKALHDKLTAGAPDDVKAIHGQFGVGPEEIDRVTAFAPLPAPGAGGPPQPLIAVTTLKPYDQKAVLAAAAPDAKEQKVKDRAFYLNDKGPSFAFLDDRTFVMARPEQLEVFLKQTRGKTEAPLAPVVRLADKHLVAVGVDVAAMIRAAPPPENLPPDAAPYKLLFKVRLATLTVDLDEQLRATAQATFATEADAKDGTAAVDAALFLVRGGFVQAMKEMNRFEDAPKMTALLNDVQEALRSAKAEQKGAVVQVEAAVAIDPETTTAALVEGAEKVRKAAKRIQISNDLKQLVLAVHSYNDATGHLPGAAIYDKNGKPLLS